MSDLLYLVCGDCKIGLRIELEDNLSEANERRDAFLEAHIRHGAFETLPEDVFVIQRMPQGFKDAEQLSAEPPVPAFPRSAQPPSLSLDGKVPPFGFPGLSEPVQKRKSPPKAADRPDWDEYFLRVAEVIAERGTCSRLKVGAVLVKSHKIISTGYNGAPSGLPHCNHENDGDMRDGHCAVAEHAERNALLSCDVSKADSTMYLTCTPCLHCARNMVTAGVRRIVYRSRYRGDGAVIEMCAKAGIELVEKGSE